MQTLRVLTGVAFLGVFATVAITAYLQYLKETGTLWQRLLGTAKDSATILWGRFCILVGSAAGGLVYVADWLNAPGIADAIKAAMQPQYVAAATILIAVVTEVARRRTL